MGEIGEYKFPNALVVPKRGDLLISEGWVVLCGCVSDFVCNLLLDAHLLFASAHNISHFLYCC